MANIWNLQFQIFVFYATKYWKDVSWDGISPNNTFLYGFKSPIGLYCSVVKRLRDWWVCSVILVLELVGLSGTVLWYSAFRRPISREDRITNVISKHFVPCFSLESFKFGCVNMKCYHKMLIWFQNVVSKHYHSSCSKHRHSKFNFNWSLIMASMFLLHMICYSHTTKWDMHISCIIIFFYILIL